MSKAAELTTAIEACLAEITAANGYATDIQGVYGFSQNVPDTAAKPYLIIRIPEDEAVKHSGNAVHRVATYQVEAVFSRAATLADLQNCHYDILKSLGYGGNYQERPLKPGWAGEESAEFDMGASGGQLRSVTASISIQYVERY
ncbi:hypothetical protein [Halopseudomonas aestusnigri]|uniref:hypothetical protein n=1 Tax=Halopseudomonas aestusnigri TaxID=857252 RepID=UPI0028C272CD|nr:hypothetical protein YSKK_13690 [Halopseudomonas aestusnigri]